MNLPCWVLFRPALCCWLILSPLGLRWLPCLCWWSTSSVQIHVLREEVAVVRKPRLLPQLFRLTWWNRPCRSCFGLFLLHLGTRPSYRCLLASERSWHTLVNFLLRKHDVDTLKFAQVRSLLVATGISSSFYPVQELALAETLIQYLRLGLLVLLEIWILFQSIRVVDRVRLTTCHLGIYPCILLQRCKHGELYPVCWGLVLDGVSNTIPFRKCLWLPIYQGPSQIAFQHLYQLTVDTIILNLGLVGIFVPVSRADQGLSCNCLEDWVLIHSRACPLLTARL